MTEAEKYQEAIDVIQDLLIHLGTATPLWVKAREIIDRERPILDTNK